MGTNIHPFCAQTNCEFVAKPKRKAIFAAQIAFVCSRLRDDVAQQLLIKPKQKPKLATAGSTDLRDQAMSFWNGNTHKPLFYCNECPTCHAHGFFPKAGFCKKLRREFQWPKLVQNASNKRLRSLWARLHLVIRSSTSTF